MVYINNHKVASSKIVLVGNTFSYFQTVYEGEIWCLCTVTFAPKDPKLNSRPVYCLRLYGRWILKNAENYLENLIFVY